MRIIFLLVSSVCICVSVSAQQSDYTKKHFVKTDDSVEFKRIIPGESGFLCTYINASPQINDIDDDSTTIVRAGVPGALICITGYMKNGKRNGVFSFFLIDSLDHKKRYKIWEQSLKDDHLNGEWRTFYLNGPLAEVSNYSNDSIVGTSRNYWIDGKTVMHEREFINGQTKFIDRIFDTKTGILKEV